MNKARKRKANGFTLAELLSTIAIFLLLAGSILATFVVALGYWKTGNAQNDAKEAVRFVLQTIEAEVSQSVIDPDPGTGYLTINPPLSLLQPPFNSPSGVLLPNGNSSQQTGSALLFNELNLANCGTPCSNPGTNPANYKQVRYSVSGGNLQRQETTYNSAGSIALQRTDTVVQISGGTLQLQVTYASAYSINLQVTAQKGIETYSLYSQVFSPAGENL